MEKLQSLYLFVKNRLVRKVVNDNGIIQARKPQAHFQFMRAETYLSEN